MATPNLRSALQMIQKILVSEFVPNAETTVYTVPANTSCVLKHGTLCNTSGGTVSVSLSIIPSGETADGSHRIISGYALAAGDTLPLASYVADAQLGDGDHISAIAGTAGAVSVILTGVEAS